MNPYLILFILLMFILFMFHLLEQEILAIFGFQMNPHLILFIIDVPPV